MSGRLGHAAAVVLSAAVLVAALHWGTKVAGGADSYGYITEAGLLTQRQLLVRQDVVRQTPWPGAQGTWAPIGYQELPQDRDAIAPVYPPGLPLLMALFQTFFGYCATFWVVPLCAAAAVWITYALGRRIFERTDIALSGALLVATSPAFLYQAMNPMSDVPVTAAWTATVTLLLSNRPLVAGLAASIAIAIRPNLVPLVLPLLLWSGLCDWRDGGNGRTRGIRGPRIFLRSLRLLDASSGLRSVRFAIGVAPSIAAIAWLNARLYGSALRSGYGELADLYAWRHVWTNMLQFARWSAETDTPIVAIAFLFFAVPWLLPPARMPFPRIVLGGFVSVVIVSYLLYLPFDAWWYLRFLLPIWPVMMLLTVAVLDALFARVFTRLRIHAPRYAVATLVALLSWHGVMVTAARGGFALWKGESRYVDVARFIAATSDEHAVFLSWQHSASIRHYANRLTLHFGRLDRRWLDRAVAHLHAIGRTPYIVLDGHEIDTFRQRFSAANRLGALDWAPVAVLQNPYVAIYDPGVRQPDTRSIPSSGGQSGRECRRPQVWPPRTHLP